MHQDRKMQQKVIVSYLFFLFSMNPPPVPPKRYKAPEPSPPPPHDKSPEKHNKSKPEFKKGELFCPVASKYFMILSLRFKIELDIV